MIFFYGKGLHLFLASANMLFIGLLLVVQAKPKLIRDDVHIIWCWFRFFLMEGGMGIIDED